MSVPVVAFFNNKGGVGKTSLLYHLAWMFSDLGISVLAVDLDPQANLTSSFLDEERLSVIWGEGDTPPLSATVFSAIKPLMDGSGDIADIEIERINEKLHLIVGDLNLSLFEDQLSETWPKCLSEDVRAFRITSAFWRATQRCAEKCGAALVLFDLGPNLGAINRACLISSDWVVIPMAPDLYSLQGLRNLGPKLRSWRKDWKVRLEVRLEKMPSMSFELPSGRIAPTGYIVMQHGERLNRPVKAYAKWMQRIPKTYHNSVLDDPLFQGDDPKTDTENLALVKHFRSLMPMAQEARKPVFHLTAADGAIGAHASAASDLGKNFEALAKKILSRIGFAYPELGSDSPSPFRP